MGRKFQGAARRPDPHIGTTSYAAHFALTVTPSITFEALRARGSTLERLFMTDDERCCGTGTCIIDARGHCWCGQQWDGEKMCRPNQIDTPSGIPEMPRLRPSADAEPA
jgi:hypothetical protein